MKTFLEYVAQDIIHKYGTDLSRTAVVFPNKRASLFLNQALAREAGCPMWSPAYITISELFRQDSQYHVADPIKQICDLYRVYVEVTGFDETLDHFYGWGQLLITDFDDIDKNMAPADKLFANLSDLHEFDDISFLNEEQRATIRKFFANFSDDQNTILKQKFLQLWSKMGEIYAGFRRQLFSQGLAYEGALYRDIVEHARIDLTYDRYIFVGFNLLQVVEQRLFQHIKEEGKAFFYWDFDHSYMQSEAGHFIQHHISDFPNELDIDRNEIYRNFMRPKHIDFVSAATEDIQARYVSQWLDTGSRKAAGSRTAIVLCNEALLPTIVHCIPDDVDQINITTGYPLQQTAIASQTIRLMKDLSLDETITRITEHARQKETVDNPFETEAHFRIYTLLNRLASLVKSGDLTVDQITLQRLIGQLIQQTSIPFHGEPAVGLQVMGVLETRNLDFDHLLLLSTNEGNMPRGINDTSFIPYSIRNAFGLTTADHKAAIYAYYFNRLLSRATDITIVYNDATTDGKSAEMSRFMRQLLVEDIYHHIEQHTLRAGQQTMLQKPHNIQKTPEVMAVMRDYFSKSLLSPTAINTYMRCPVRFYYAYAEGLHELDDIAEGVINNRAFGDIFHKAAETLYRIFLQRNSLVKSNDITEMLNRRIDIVQAVDEAFAQQFKVDSIKHLHLNGLQLINHQVIVHYLEQLLKLDRNLTPFTIESLEQPVVKHLFVPTLHLNVRIGGYVDRIDRMTTPSGEQIRIIDYKTSSRDLKPLKSVEDIFDEKQIPNHSDYYLQALLYARIYRDSHQIPVAPALLFIQHAAAEDYNPVLKFGKEPILDVATDDGDRFSLLLNDKINEIFNSEIPFEPTHDEQRCTYCPFVQLCGL